MQKSADPSLPRTPPAGLSRLLVLAVLVAAVLHLLAVQLSPAAALRQNLGADAPMARHARGRADRLVPVERLADGGNLELHFRESPPSPQSGTMISAIYFGLTYDLYPARPFVGDGRGVINGDVTLRAADRPPTHRWMRDHGVAALVTYSLQGGAYSPPTVQPLR